MLKNSQEKITKLVQKKEFECKIEYLMRNSCSRCPKNRECEESDRDERDKGRQDKKLSNSSIQERKPIIPQKGI